MSLVWFERNTGGLRYWKCERGDRVALDGVARKATGIDGRDELLAAAASIGDRRAIDRCRQLEAPQLRAGACIEGANAVVVGAADEGQAAGGEDGAACADATGVLQRIRQVVADAQRRAPRNVSSVDVHGDQAAPRRLLTAAGASPDSK